MARLFPFLVFFAVFVFVVGFLSGYYLERTGIAYSKSRIDDLRNEVENMQIQEMFIAGEEVDCRLLYTTVGSVSWRLYDLVDQLKETKPESQEFWDMKRQADFLSLRAWIMSRSIREKCTEDLLPVLYIYSLSPECDEQDQALQAVKERHSEVLVYAIDFYLDEPAVKLVKDAYQINSTPAMIINHQLYGQLDQDGLEQVVCENINCTG